MWGHEVVPCLNLQEARDAVQKGPRPDLILVDLTLPDSTPQSLAETLTGPEFDGIPLALTSGRDDLASWGQAMKARQTFLKPVDIVQLKSFLTKLQGEKTAARRDHEASP